MSKNCFIPCILAMLVATMIHLLLLYSCAFSVTTLIGSSVVQLCGYVYSSCKCLTVKRGNIFMLYQGLLFGVHVINVAKGGIIVT